MTDEKNKYALPSELDGLNSMVSRGFKNYKDIRVYRGSTNTPKEVITFITLPDGYGGMVSSKEKRIGFLFGADTKEFNLLPDPDAAEKEVDMLKEADVKSREKLIMLSDTLEIVGWREGFIYFSVIPKISPKNGARVGICRIKKNTGEQVYAGGYKVSDLFWVVSYDRDSESSITVTHKGHKYDGGALWSCEYDPVPLPCMLEMAERIAAFADESAWTAGEWADTNPAVRQARRTIAEYILNFESESDVKTKWRPDADLKRRAQTILNTLNRIEEREEAECREQEDRR